MKISIKRETFINHKCESLTKQLMDTFYDKLFTISRNFIACSDKFNRKRILSIDVRIEQAYQGCSSFHFFVSLNGLEEFHLEIYKGSKPDMYDEESLRYRYQRYDWIKKFEDYLEFDMGKNNSKLRFEERHYKIDQKEKTKTRMKILKSRWVQFKKMEKEFSFMK